MLRTMIAIAEDAARHVLDAYTHGDFGVEYKSPDDPVTRVDREANALIIAALARAYPGVPVVAEESDPSVYAGFAEHGSAFFVDPIDGTREFVARTGEFAVMLGYAQAGRASLGVVVRPTPWCVVAGGEGSAFSHDESGREQPLALAPESSMQNARVCVSRSRSGGRVRQTLDRLGARELVPIGSAGLKVVEVARGGVHLYAHPGEAGKAWDYCAPEAIVRAAGGVLLAGDGSDVMYTEADPLRGRGVVCGREALAREAVRLLHATSASRNGAR
jgi:3'(2'), 5'-bisphosphate nucleotidase